MNEERTHGDCSAINDDEELPRPPSSEPISFGYTNHRGEQATRRAIPIRIYWGTTDYHPEGWIFEGYDVEKHAMRLYALRDCDFSSVLTVRERGGECPNCLQPVEIGQVVMCWDDAGEMHADCSNPYRLDVDQPAESPPLVLLAGSPMRHVLVDDLSAINKLRTALKAYDEYVAPCPFDPSKTTHPNSLDPCKVCSATMGTGCYRKANAGADVVAAVRKILDGDA